MSNRIRVLLLEDSPADVELVERELGRGGLAVDPLHVTAKDAYVRALDEFRPQLVLADYSLPGFDGITALRLARERGHEMPFILVSGAVGEELAVEALKLGATDYVLKDRLERLVPSVRRALHEVEERDRRLRAEAALRASEERFRTSIASMLDAFGIYSAVRDESGRIVDFRVEYVNEAHCRYNQMRREEQVGHLLLELFPAYREGGLFDKFCQVVETGEPLAIESPMPPRLPAPPTQGNGRQFTVDLQAVKLEDGVAVSGRDVTERVRAEQALRASEERFRVLLDAAPYAVVVVDQAGRIVLANPRVREFFGYEPDELVGETLGTLVPEALRSAHEQHRHDYLRDPGPRLLGRDRLLSARHRDGRIFPAEISLTPVRSGDGERLVMATVVDITERRAAEEARIAREAAEAGNRSKSEFLSRMSHELRTPLNAVLGFAQLLDMDPLTHDQRESVRYISRAGHHLLDLINEVLDISLIESGQMTISPEPIALADLLGEVAGLMAPLGADRAITIEALDPACARHVLADRQRLKQVLLNLLANAVKYNRDGGSIRVSCSLASPERLRIAVDDSGYGIGPEQMDRLFRPFDRLGAEQGQIEGTGMGLALSKGLVEAMGGRIGVESTPGVGSTFWVEFVSVDGPVERYERSREPAIEQTPAAVTGTRQVVLYVEDNLSNLQLVERILERRPGIELQSAMQGRLAIELAQRLRPDLILLDVHLPDLPGLEVLHRLRADAATRAIPIVVVSADATPAQIRRFTEDGAFGYLTKPLDVARFLELIDVVLDASGARPDRGGDPPSAWSARARTCRQEPSIWQTSPAGHGA